MFRTIIIPSDEPRFADPAFLELIAGLGDESTVSNWDLLVSTAAPDSRAEEELYQRWVQMRRVDGIVLTRIRAKDWRFEIQANHHPTAARPFAYWLSFSDLALPVTSWLAAG